MTTAISIPTPTWATAIAQPAAEFPATPLSVITGALPPELQGTLYRNGPARLGRGEIPVGHWFDGDGAVLAVKLNGGEAIATYRYVKTKGYQQEAAQGRLIFGNYGMTAPGPLWNHWRYPLKNAANTSVLALPDRLLAQWEGGNPHALDLDTLDTWGETTFDQQLESPWSAHPKVDPETGDIYNFGVKLGAKATLHIYRSDRRGHIQQHNAVALDGVPLIHDMALAGRYLVFLVPPVRIQPLPVLAGLKSYSDAMEWQPDLGTRVIVCDRATLQVIAQAEVDPWFQWHIANGFETQAGQLAIDLAQYQDFQINQRLKEVATGEIHTAARSPLVRIWINPQTAAVEQQMVLVDRDGEFPTVAPTDVGRDARFTYLSLHRHDVDQTKELYGTVARYDHQADQLTVADFGHHRYPSEPIYIPPTQPDQAGWIITVVFDGAAHQSEVWIHASDRLADEPVCRLALPGIVPPSFHGTWAG